MTRTRATMYMLFIQHTNHQTKPNSKLLIIIGTSLNLLIKVQFNLCLAHNMGLWVGSVSVTSNG